jgi:hypothetical protein
MRTNLILILFWITSKSNFSFESEDETSYHNTNVFHVLLQRENESHQRENESDPKRKGVRPKRKQVRAKEKMN